MGIRPGTERMRRVLTGLAGVIAGGLTVWLIADRPHLPGWSRWTLVGVASVGGAMVLITVVLGPGARWLAGVPEVSRKESQSLGPDVRIEAVSAARVALLQSASGFAVLLGLVFTAGGLVTTSRSLDTTQQGQITDRYTRSIEQLGSRAPEVRLGGIFALERISRDSARDRQAIIMVLASYLRVHAQDPPPPGQDRTRLAVDVSAALTVIGRRELAAEERIGFRPDLSQIDFHGKNLRWADLRRVNLRGADLRKADLTNASLSSALVGGAQLDGALLRCTSLKVTGLVRATLAGADLRHADLRGAALDDADLHGARIDSAQIAQARTSANVVAGPQAAAEPRSVLCTS